jgi:hypothetical protein
MKRKTEFTGLLNSLKTLRTNTQIELSLLQDKELKSSKPWEVEVEVLAKKKELKDICNRIDSVKMFV